MKITFDAPLVGEFDVLVIGGGVAGTFAAISAARLGASVMLVEKSGMLGGTATMGGVDFPGLFHAWGKQIIAGPCWESILRANQRGGARIPDIVYKPQNHWDMQVRVDSFIYATVLDEMCQESSVRVALHSMPVCALETGDGISVTIARKEGPGVVLAKRAIDATGDANFAAIMGCPLERTASPQPGTLVNRIGGYELARIDSALVARAFASRPDVDLQGGDAYRMLKDGCINMHMAADGAETSEGRAQLEIEARAYLQSIVDIYKSVPGLEGIRVTYAAPEFGVRESLRIVGEARVTREDYARGYIHPDSVCYSFYPIDLHVRNGIEINPLPEGAVPGIPLGALVPAGSNKLLAAGRCASGDARAASAYRVEASCMAMGQAAGAAAAISAATGAPVMKTDRTRLREALRGLGHIVPEA